jgi:hypothetical protein
MENPIAFLFSRYLPESVKVLVINMPKSSRMKPALKRQKPSLLFMLSLICTFAGSALLLLTVNLSAHLGTLISGGHIYSDYSVLPLVLALLCLGFLIPVYMGVILLRVFLRYQLRKGRLTPKIGILSGIGLWGLGVSAFAFFGSF